MTEFTFDPHQLTLESSKPYTLHFVNSGSVTHTFSAPSFFQTTVIRDDGAGLQVRKSGGTVDIAAGTTAEVHVIPQQAGTFAFECTQPLHAAFGMTGSITVR